LSNRTCPLCESGEGEAFYSDDRDYYCCPNCRLVYVEPDQFLSAQAEKAHYDLHENSPDDPRYRRFLSRLFVPMSERLTPHSSGLDFGSGPGPTLSVMFAEAGHTMQLFDPFYAPDTTVFDRQFDFITASEVVEHLHHPRRELDRLWTCLKPGGHLGLMTKLVIDRQAFAGWHYKDDPTHVCFYSQQTCEWLAEHWQAQLTVADKDAVMFAKAD
jgi:SAM-dependent methyltransferase